MDTIYDKKDKLKTKLFQRKIEFLFDVNKYKSQFESSTILNNWRYDRTNNSPQTTTNKIKDNNKKQFSIDSTDQSLSNHLESSDQVDQQTDLKDDSSTTNQQQQQQQQQLDNYTNYLYECENDASTLFKCKLCSKLMTKQQSLNLKCQLAILNSNGDYIYLHVPDEQFDMTNLLRLLKEKLKTWQSVYWFLWSLIKSFKCRKCNQWFRLTDLNRCRLNEQTYCLIHDGRNNFVYTKNSASNTINNNSTEISSSSSSGCTCIHINHIMETSSFTNLYANSPICTDDTNSTQFTSEQRLARYLDNIMEDLDKHSDIIFHGRVITNTNKDLINEHYSICDLIEDFIQT